MLRLGMAPCFFHADPARAIFKGKTLLYMEESLCDWFMSEGVATLLLPTITAHARIKMSDLMEDIDALVLQGGTDVAPENYSETPLKPEWKGDIVRDKYEIALVKEALKQNKPILGVCRGAQLLNVAYGGSLYQDIQTQVPKSLNHRNWDIYDQNFHEISLESDSKLAKLFPGVTTAKVNTVHHQAVRELGKGLKAEARCKTDGVVEAIRAEGDRYAFAFQWHPEFHGWDDKSVLDARPILKEFLEEAKKRKG